MQTAIQGSTQTPLNRPHAAGSIWLVGAGPGDVELLTLKAVKALELASVVVHDRLVSPDILALIPTTTLSINAGKACGQHRMSQNHINQLLVDLAQSGHTVVRLKGGDPFMFGRGGEELAFAKQAGVACHIVPGITAAAGCAAAIGLPLTHRDCARSVHFMAAQASAPLPTAPQLPSVENMHEKTLVFYMGLNNATALAEQLIAHGLSPDTPVAIIEKGTLPEQRLLTATLATLPQLVSCYKPQSPSLIVVGHVVDLCDHPALKLRCAAQSPHSPSRDKAAVTRAKQPCCMP